MIPPVPELITERFRLRGLEEDDVGTLWPSFSDETAMLYWSRGPFADKVELRQWLFDSDWGGRTWIAEPLKGGEAVCRIVASGEAPEAAEIGYITALGQERKGIARECVTAVIGHLIEAEGFGRIWADVDPRNTASNGLLKTLGFREEERIINAVETHIGWCDSLIWTLSAADWKAR
ncbi:hypothetical protein GCM10023115_13790 [Pontixanthobacter gangjinensis]|uniref:GNAT family N-acetyltransferase n=1 Tax=Pontixanthobacter gangjinensis TaxID=1028742 RepID=A0A6I4SLM8_9SPHN|nr:GNAT family protein [Pontixanthobacter gangjinensis]MXO56623.1 GNAT family N-acetyltransferase [Pontixanthobacter gangjinensis]